MQGVEGAYSSVTTQSGCFYTSVNAKKNTINMVSGWLSLLSMVATSKQGATIRRPRRRLVIVVSHLAVACSGAESDSPRAADVATAQGGICMGDTAGFAPTMGDLAVAKWGFH